MCIKLLVDLDSDIIAGQSTMEHGWGQKYW